MIIRKTILAALCLFIMSAGAQACSPPVPTPGSENAIIERASAAASITVIQSEADQSDAGQKDVISMQAKVLDVYKGGLSAGETITIYSRNHGTCSIFLTSGITRDVLLIEENGTYYLGTESNFLSPEGWEALKQGKTLQ